LGKTIVVTGASSGFGKLAVLELLERGHTVIAGIRGGEARAAELFPGNPRPIAFDLHLDRPETFPGLRALIEERFGGRLDVLVNNAGYGLFGALEDMAPAQLREQMETNFFGPALLTRELLPALRAARGRVINLSSIVGRYCLPMYGAYSSSKFALEALTEALRYDAAASGVQVALVEPGGFRTEFNQRSYRLASGAGDPASPYAARSQRLVALFNNRRASARLGDPRRVARLIARLSEKPRLRRLRYPVGLDAHFLLALGWLLPDSWRVGLIDGFFRRAVFGGR
jgi:NAD(P)-dependent dehydrogenase (short-subunit alcohol dehydrogenase family)